MLLATVLVLTAAVGTEPRPSYASKRESPVEMTPDPRLSRKVKRKPTLADGDDFELRKGSSRTELIHALGHPCAVGRRDGEFELWFYEWEDQHVGFRFENGRVLAPFYIIRPQ